MRDGIARNLVQIFCEQPIDALVAGPDTVALEVRGDSMFPLAHNRDVIFVGPPRRDLSGLVGFECAVALQDGRRFFKIIERGSKPHLFDLRSYNAEPIRDVEVHPRRRTHHSRNAFALELQKIRHIRYNSGANLHNFYSLWVDS